MKSVVVFSGGMDSAVCLVKELKEGREPIAISFDYEQRHVVELGAAVRICRALGVNHAIISLNFPVNSALVNTGNLDVNEPSPLDPSLPASFVPGRNATFLSIAWGVAQSIDAPRIVTGVCETDFSGYPDCRMGFITKLAVALGAAYGERTIACPLMYKSKKETWALALELGCFGLVLASHTCYNGEISRQYDWGYGCAECPACHLREKGFSEMIKSLESNDSSVKVWTLTAEQILERVWNLVEYSKDGRACVEAVPDDDQQLEALGKWALEETSKYEEIDEDELNDSI